MFRNAVSLSGSGRTPFLSMTWPKKRILVCENGHLSAMCDTCCLETRERCTKTSVVFLCSAAVDEDVVNVTKNTV